MITSQTNFDAKIRKFPKTMGVALAAVITCLLGFCQLDLLPRVTAQTINIPLQRMDLKDPKEGLGSEMTIVEEGNGRSLEDTNI